MSDLYERKNPHRLYRDKENAILTGVCAGLANYFGLEPERLAPDRGGVHPVLFPLRGACLYHPDNYSFRSNHRICTRMKARKNSGVV